MKVLIFGGTGAMGEVVNIASPESKTWGEILKIYKETLAKSTRGGVLLTDSYASSCRGLRECFRKKMAA